MECFAARKTAILLDQSSFGKHLIQGKGSLIALQKMCSGNIDVEKGKVVYTHMLNSKGGIECDITINRMDEHVFLIISSATTHARDKSWIERHIGENNVTLTDVTSGYAVLSLQGPNSRSILREISNSNLDNETFPSSTSQEIELGYAKVIANRLTYVGELGWELHIPTEFAQHVFDKIWKAGDSFGLKAAGYHALEHLRSERAYREYELDLTPEDTPYEAGLGFTVSLDKKIPFKGQDALIKQKERKVLKKRLVMFKLKDPQAVLFHEEPIKLNDKIVGYISSGAYAFNLNCSVGMGYVRHPEGVTKDLLESGSWEIEIAGKNYLADASLKAFFDPSGDRVMW